jgi:hypothetical protein
MKPFNIVREGACGSAVGTWSQAQELQNFEDTLRSQVLEPSTVV